MAQWLYAAATMLTAACVEHSRPQTEQRGEWPTPVPTGTPAPNYRGMVTRLLVPLGGMIVASRNSSPTVANWLAFQSESGKIRAELEGNFAPQAIQIRASISNVEAAWPTRDTAAMERERERLLDVH
jgi:hypothetical protein